MRNKQVRYACEQRHARFSIQYLLPSLSQRPPCFNAVHMRYCLSIIIDKQQHQLTLTAV